MSSERMVELACPLACVVMAACVEIFARLCFGLGGWVLYCLGLS